MNLIDAIEKLDNPHDPYNKDMVVVRAILKHLLTDKEEPKEKKVKKDKKPKVWVDKSKG